MKRLVGLGLAAVMTVAALSAGSPNKANAQSAGLVSAVLSRVEQNHASLKSLRAGIVMEKYNSQLRDAEKYYGVVAYLPGEGRSANVKIEWEKPQHEILSVMNGEYMLYRVRLKTLLKGKANNPKNTSSGLVEMMNMSRQELQKRFQPFQDVREETLWGGVSTIHLKLVPTGSASYKYAEVWVDSSGMPVQSKIVEKNDDATTIRLNNIERNIRISLKDIEIQVGSDVKILRT